MKKLFLTLTFMLVFGFIGFSQILASAAQKPTLNELGDPLTNIIDQNGAKQGDWFYIDVYGNPILKEVYKDHQRIAVHYAFSINQKQIVKWQVKEDWESNRQLIASYKAKIESWNLFSTLPDDRQLAIVLGKNGSVRVAPIGSWDMKESDVLVKDLSKKIKEANLNNQKDVFILF